MEHYRQTQVGIYNCVGESQLAKRTTVDSVFALDVVLAKVSVQQGMSAAEAKKHFEEGGKIRGSVDAQLDSCLSTIEKGECPHYPKN